MQQTPVIHQTRRKLRTKITHWKIPCDPQYFEDNFNEVKLLHVVGTVGNLWYTVEDQLGEKWTMPESYLEPVEDEELIID